MPDTPKPRSRRPAPAAARYRRLVRCEVCFRQFDAAGLAPGERFRCVCGRVLQVPRGGAKGAQEAPVVRCASCGAPRAAGAANCSFCTAPFALGEGARNTLCPVCASRIGDSQRYCHSCGTLIAPEALAGGPTNLACPACRPPRKLASRRIAEATTTLAMLECGGCAGIWLGHRTFDSLQERAQREVAPESFARLPGPARSANRSAPSPAKLTYRPCPVCQKLMLRRNFALTSGIVVDVCGADGLWFDAEELDGILEWIRGGGLERTEERLAEERKAAARHEAIAKKDRQELPNEVTSQGHWLDLIGKLASAFMDATARFR